MNLKKEMAGYESPCRPWSLRVVHLRRSNSRHKWPGGISQLDCCSLRARHDEPHQPRGVEVLRLKMETCYESQDGEKTGYGAQKRHVARLTRGHMV